MKSCIENIYKLKVNQIIDYIKFNLHQPLQLNVIADIVNMSQRQLLRMMSSVLNEPLYPYVARQHVERSVLYMQSVYAYMGQIWRDRTLYNSLEYILRNTSIIQKRIKNRISQKYTYTDKIN